MEVKELGDVGGGGGSGEHRGGGGDVWAGRTNYTCMFGAKCIMAEQVSQVCSAQKCTLDSSSEVYARLTQKCTLDFKILIYDPNPNLFDIQENS